MPARFNTDRSLFEAFPSARGHVGVEPRDIDPLDLLADLSARAKLDEAASLAAYLLPRRDAVAWGCRSLRALQGDPRGFDTPCLRAAEAWAGQPDETRRTAAREGAAGASDDDPTTWVARAAAWSGGNVSTTVPAPVPSHLAAVSVRIALLLAMRRLAPEERLARGRSCIADARRLADAGQ